MFARNRNIHHRQLYQPLKIKVLCETGVGGLCSPHHPASGGCMPAFNLSEIMAEGEHQGWQWVLKQKNSFSFAYLGVCLTGPFRIQEGSVVWSQYPNLHVLSGKNPDLSEVLYKKTPQTKNNVKRIKDGMESDLPGRDESSSLRKVFCY